MSLGHFARDIAACDIQVRHDEFQAAEIAKMLLGNIEIWTIRFNPVDMVRGWGSLRGPPVCWSSVEISKAPGLHGLHSRVWMCAAAFPGMVHGGKKKKKSPGFQNITLGLFHFYVVSGS